MAEDKPNAAPDQQDETAAANRNDKAGATAAATSSAMPGMIILAVSIIIGAAAAVLVSGMVAGNGNATAASAEADPTEPAKTHEKKGEHGEKNALEFCIPGPKDPPLMVNVYRTKQRRFLAVKAVFELRDENTRVVLEGKASELQHILLSTLKTKTLEELDAPESVNAVAREIQETVNERLELDNGIIRVYFTQFVVQ